MSDLSSSIDNRKYVVCGDLATSTTVFPLFVALAVTFVVYVTALFDQSKQTVDMANAIGPSILLLSMAVAGWKTVRRYPISAWTAFFWYLVNSALFYGLGPLVYVFGNEATISTMQTGSFPLNQHQLLRANLLNSVGIVATLLAFAMVASQFGADSEKRMQLLRRIRYRVPLSFVAVAFLSVGATLRYLLILPYLFGQTSFVVPGVIMTLGQLFDLGLAVVAFLAVRRGGKWKWLLWTLVPLHVSTCLLQFAKSNVALALILTGLGAYLGHRNVRRLSIWLIVAFVAIILLQPFAIYGRSAARELGDGANPNLRQRFEIVKTYFSHPTRYQSRKEKEGVQTGWTRLCYAGPQTFAMKRYDAGLPGDNLKNAWIIAIPRILWPNKPKFDESLVLYELATGREGTHVGVTVYGDGYWQFGWFGVVGFGMLMGGIFAITTRWSLVWVQAGNLLFLPVVLMGIDMAVRGPNNFFIKTIISPLPIYLAYVFAAKVASTLVGKDMSRTNDLTNSSRTSKPSRPKEERKVLWTSR